MDARVRWVLAALAVVAVYAALAAYVGVGPLLAALAGVRPLGLLLALGVVVLAYALRSARWGVYLGRLRVLPPEGPIRRLAAFAMGLPQGKWGVGVKTWALRTRAAVPYGAILPAVLAERASDVVGALAFLALGLLVAPGADPWLLVSGAVVAVAAALVVRSRFFARGLVAALAWVPWVRHRSARILRAHARLGEELTLRGLAFPSLLAAVAFVLEGVVLWLLAVPGMGLPFTLAEAILVAAVVDVAGMVVLVPGGVGAAEGSAMVLLTLHGVPVAEAAALTLLYRASVLWFGVLLGFVGVGALRVMPAGTPVEAAASARR